MTLCVISTYLLFYYFFRYRYFCKNKVIIYEGCIVEKKFEDIRSISFFNPLKSIKNIKKRYIREYYYLKIDDETKIKVFCHENKRKKYKIMDINEEVKIRIYTLPSAIYTNMNNEYVINGVLFTEILE